MSTKFFLCLSFMVSCVFTSGVSAAELYVDANGTNPQPPYVDWSTAATNIQDAIDASTAGDSIWVTNGIYQYGGKTLPGLLLTNRVVIDKAVTVESVHGPETTLILGYQVPGTTNDDAAVRCAYVSDGATLAGFTLANGATLKQTGANTNSDGNGGGVLCQSTNALVSNCIIVSNSCCIYGAGVFSGTLSQCQINYNASQISTSYGGCAVAGSAAFDSTIRGNFAVGPAGNLSAGAYLCTLSNCVVDGNLRGGVSSCWLNNCLLENNTNSSNGGGAAKSILTNCIVAGNQSGAFGGGLFDCVLNNCTVSNNWAASGGGGIYEDSLQTNAPGQHNFLIANSTPLLGGGLYLQPGASGQSNWNVVDWTFSTNSAAQDGGGIYLTSTRSILNQCTFLGNTAGRNGGGFCPASAPSPLVISNSTFSGNLATGNGGGAYQAALNNCVVSANRAGNGGGVYGSVSNCVVNDNIAGTNGGGVYFSSSTTVILPGCFLTNNSAANGGGAYGGIFTNCVFCANSAVTNGGAVYGAATAHCLIISNQATSGGGAYSGGSTPVYPSSGVTYVDSQFVNNTALKDGGGIYNLIPITGSSCVIQGNTAANNGGGVYGGTISRSLLCSNSAVGNGGGTCNGSATWDILYSNAAGTNGGGSYNCTLANCLAYGNFAILGGGAYGGSQNSSTIVNNQAMIAGGGVYYPSGGTITGCILYYNSASSNANYTPTASYNYCCTTPLPPVGSQDITNDPSFIDFANANFRLQTNSPCIDAGNTPPGPTDLDARPRTVGARVDIGAYEFQGAGMGEFIAWLQQHGLPANGNADHTDTDHDRLDNWQEWQAGTDPTNALSVLEMFAPTFTNNSSDILVSWQSVTNRTYFLQKSSDLAQSPFTTFQSNIVGQAGTTEWVDTNSTATMATFYRVGVQ